MWWHWEIFSSSSNVRVKCASGFFCLSQKRIFHLVCFCGCYTMCPKNYLTKKSFFFQPPDYRAWYKLGAFLAASHDLLFPAEEKNVQVVFDVWNSVWWLCLISISQKIILQLYLKWPIQCQPSAIANMFFMSLSLFLPSSCLRGTRYDQWHNNTPEIFFPKSLRISTKLGFVLTFVILLN